VAGRGIEPRT